MIRLNCLFRNFHVCSLSIWSLGTQYTKVYPKVAGTTTTTKINTRWKATQMVMAAKLTRLIQLHLLAESCTICSSRSRRTVRKPLDTSSFPFMIYNPVPAFGILSVFVPCVCCWFCGILQTVNFSLVSVFLFLWFSRVIPNTGSRNLVCAVYSLSGHHFFSSQASLTHLKVIFGVICALTFAFHSICLPQLLLQPDGFQRWTASHAEATLNVPFTNNISGLALTSDLYVTVVKLSFVRIRRHNNTASDNQIIYYNGWLVQRLMHAPPITQNINHKFGHSLNILQINM
jgi:hypothetical protein